MISGQNNMSGESQPLMCVQKMRRHDTFRSWLFSKSTHHRVTEARVSSISSLLSILRNLTPVQLPYFSLSTFHL